MRSPTALAEMENRIKEQQPDLFSVAINACR